MADISIIKHARGAPGLRLFGLGPSLIPSRGLNQLQQLLTEHTFWAADRKKNSLRLMIKNSTVVVSLWENKRLIGFGRATSDKIFRAVLWDVVIADDCQGIGLGKILIEAILKTPAIKKAERVYLMTTNCSDFYKQMGFRVSKNQQLLVTLNPNK